MLNLCTKIVECTFLDVELSFHELWEAYSDSSKKNPAQFSYFIEIQDYFPSYISTHRINEAVLSVFLVLPVVWWRLCVYVCGCVFMCACVGTCVNVCSAGTHFHDWLHIGGIWSHRLITCLVCVCFPAVVYCLCLHMLGSLKWIMMFNIGSIRWSLGGLGVSSGTPAWFPDIC